MTTQISDKVIQSIPLFYWNDQNYPDISVWKYEDSKEDLRLLRNLVYAKHGYVFKSTDLQNIFKNFKWYVPDEFFSEENFTKREKNLIEKIQRYEKQ